MGILTTTRSVLTATTILVPQDTTLLAGETTGFAWNPIDTTLYFPTWDVAANQTMSRVQVRTAGVDVFSDPQTFFVNSGTSPKYVRSFSGSGLGIAWSPHNSTLQSQTLDNAAWTATAITVTANDTAGPDGTVTAEKMVETNTATSLIQEASSVAIVSGFIYTVSVYVKSSNIQWIFLSFSDTSTGTNGVGKYFDLTNTLTGTTVTSGSGWSFQAASVVALANSWNRIQLSVSTGAATSFMAMRSASADNSTTRATSATYWLWGAQRNRGISATRYIATTSATVIGIPVSYQEGLLTEPAATNLLLKSQDFTLGTWVDKGGIGGGSTILSVSTDVTTAPDGTNTADKIIGVNGDVNFKTIDQAITKAASAITYTFSVYVKISDASLPHVELNFGFGTGFGTAAFGCDFDLSAGTVFANPFAYGTGWSVSTASIVPVGNGWFRCSVTGTTDAVTTTVWSGITPVDASGNSSWTGNGSKGMYFWGAQVEVQAANASTASSHIPTTTASVTRSADGVTCSSSAIPTGSPMSYFADLVAVATPGTPSVVDLVDSGVGNHEVLLYTSGLNVHQYNFQSGAGSAIDDVIGTFTVGPSFRCAGRFQSSNFQGAVNGTLGTPSLSGTVASGYNTLGMGTNGGTGILDGFIRKVIVVPRAYSDAELQAKTT